VIFHSKDPIFWKIQSAYPGSLSCDSESLSSSVACLMSLGQRT